MGDQYAIGDWCIDVWWTFGFAKEKVPGTENADSCM